ncbi:MAG: substrate-binding domain-containing protein [Eubacteriales bacterium]
MNKTIKRCLTLVMVTAMVFGSLTISSFAATKVALNVEGKAITTTEADGAIFIDAANRTQVPMRVLANSLNKSITWDAASQTATIDGKVIIKIGKNIITNANGTIKMDTVAIVKNGRTYVPARFIAEALGLGVSTSTNSGTLTVNLAKLTGKVIIAGSTSSQPLSGELTTAFMKQYPGVNMEVQGGGSGVGVTATKSGACDIGALSRELTATEFGYKEYIFATDGVAVIVNKDVDVSGLTVDQIRKIFIGETKNWKDVGGIDKPIVVISREAGSGTRSAFTELTKVLDSKKVDKTTVNAIVQPSTGAVLQTVENTPYSIGYISLGAMQNTVKLITVDGVACTEANVINKTYKISRPFLYITKDEESLATQTYLNWVMSTEAQKIVSKDYISILSK